MTAVHRLVLYFKFELVFPFGVSLLPCSLILIWSFSNLEGKVFHLVLITFNDEYGGFLILMRVIVYTHHQELMESMKSHGSSSLLFMMNETSETL